MELIKDYEFAIHYHLGKANVVADALSRKSSTSLASLTIGRDLLLNELRTINVKLMIHETSALLAQFR